MTHITQDEWQAELDRLNQSDPGLTMREIGRLAGWGSAKTKRLITKGLAAGTYAAGFRRQQDSTGRNVAVPVYRIIKPAKDK